MAIINKRSGMLYLEQIQRKKIYFENLNTIRFVAASLVIIHHTEQFKSLLHVPNQWSNNVILLIGNLGVVLFFVLSGFLISFLLFSEEKLTATIRIKDFYMRRILRIWPLYFVIVCAAFFVFPLVEFFTIEGFERHKLWKNLFSKLMLYALFLPNLVLSLYGMITYVSQTWSIGAEEQFYLVWPYLNKKIKNKWLLLISVIFTYLFIKLLIQFLQISHIDMVKKFWDSTPIDCMAIGGIFALIIHETSPFTISIRKILLSKLFQWIIFILTFYLIATGVYLPYFHYEIYSFLFGILICNFAFNKRRIFSMENAITSYLGKISYGLYMFHPIAIVFSVKVLQRHDLLTNFMLYPCIFILLIIISALSYELFEKKFINKKTKYSTVISGDNAKDNILV